MAIEVELIRDGADKRVHILAGVDAARCGHEIANVEATWSGDVTEVTCSTCVGGDDDSDV